MEKPKAGVDLEAERDLAVVPRARRQWEKPATPPRGPERSKRRPQTEGGSPVPSGSPRGRGGRRPQSRCGHPVRHHDNATADPYSTSQGRGAEYPAGVWWRKRVASQRMAVLTMLVKHPGPAPSTWTHWPVRRARLQSANTRGSPARDRRDSTQKPRRHRGALEALIQTSQLAEMTGRKPPRRMPRRRTGSPKRGGPDQRMRASAPPGHTVRDPNPRPRIGADELSRAAHRPQRGELVGRPSILRRPPQTRTCSPAPVTVVARQRSRRAVSCHAGAGPVA